ncbi:hypothetical protein F5B20DRAFT_571027 [Whalleya microplaca]|nr:hypothetical protein F5B20DRAFT_571027 [Whalleya microplaca]
METITVSNASSYQSIRTGIWTNWSRGSTFGATLTLHRQEADLLIAFTAFFIAFIGSRFWRLCCLVIHRCHSSSDPQGTFCYQRQVILRNSSSSEAGLWELTKLLWTWRRTAKGLFAGVFPCLVTAASCVAAFVVAGGFSSRISTSVGNEVLMDGANCGYLGNDGSLGALFSITVSAAKRVTASLNYLQECYSSDGSGTLGCDLYTLRRLPTVKNSTAACPFPGNICRSNSSNLVLDSGLINSHDHLGINFPSSERILWRKVLSCAPLVTTGYSSNYSNAYGNYTRYYYGPPGPLAHSVNNFSYETMDIESQYRYESTGEDGDIIYTGRTYSITPIPELTRTDGDLTLLFLSGNGVLFSEPLDDDWYRAIIPFGTLFQSNSEGEAPIYAMAEAASPMGCIEQFQWCSSSATECGPLASASDAYRGAAEKFGTTIEAARNPNELNSSSTASHFDWIHRVVGQAHGDLATVLGTLNSQSLASQQTTVQAAVVDAVSGTTDPALTHLNVRPLNQYQRDMCYNQKIRSSDYGSFSLFWLLFTYILGALVIAVSYSAEPILACLYERRKYKEYSHLEWVTNATLQLQRLANEDPDSKVWSCCIEDVPVTQPGVQLGRLDLRDPNHPKIFPPHMADSTILATAISPHARRALRVT